MSAKNASKGGYLPNLRVASQPKQPKRDAEAEDRAALDQKLKQLRKDFLYREKLRRDRGRKR